MTGKKISIVFCLHVCCTIIFETPAGNSELLSVPLNFDLQISDP